MTRLLIFLSLLASGIGWGCATDLAATATPPTRSVKVELQLSPDPAERITRAADEEAIRDINLYLFGQTTDDPSLYWRSCGMHHCNTSHVFQIFPYAPYEAFRHNLYILR